MGAATAWLLAGALWAGCLLPGPWWVALAGLAGLAGIGAAGVAAVRLGCRRRGLVVLAAVALGAVGSGLAGGRDALANGGLLPRLAEHGGVAAFDGTIVAEPRTSAGGAWTVVRVATMDGRETRERALLRLRDQRDLPAFGAPVTFRASARPLDREGFDAYARRLYARVELHPVDPVRVTGRAPPLTRLTTLGAHPRRGSASLGPGPRRAAGRPRDRRHARPEHRTRGSAH
jgi:hypothetical protein